MKTLMLSLVAVALVAASCSSTKQTSSGKSDDVYVTQTTPSATPSMGSGNNDASQGGYNNSDQYKTDDSYQSPDYSTSGQYSDSNGTNYITNNYYGTGGGWYDTQMSGPYFGFNYFSPFYTGFSYYNPVYYSPGFSFSIGFGIGFGYGYGYYNPWYAPYAYYNPWYGPYYPYGGGYCGGGYYGDYYGGSCSGYYAPYYGYYGYRGASASNTTGDVGGRHYKTEDNSGGSDVGRTLTGGSLNGTLLNTNDNGRNINGNVVNGQEVGNVKNTNNTGRDTHFENSKDLQHSNPDQNIRQLDAPPAMDRNVTSPERGNMNNNSPRQNGGQGTPRNTSLLSHAVSSNTFASSSNMKHVNGGMMQPQIHSSVPQHASQPTIANPRQSQQYAMNAGKQQQKTNSHTSSANTHSSSAFKGGSGNSSHQMSQPQARSQGSGSSSYSGGGYSGGGQRSSGNQSRRR